MGKNITQHGIFSKNATGGSGGGGTGNMNTSTYDPAGISEQIVGQAISLDLATAKLKTDWIDGQLYLITDPISPLVRFYAYGTVDYIIPGAVETPILSTVGLGIFDGAIVPTIRCIVTYNINGSAGAEITSVFDQALNVYVTNNSANSTAQITEQLRVSGINCAWHNCTFTDTSGVISTSFEDIEASDVTVKCTTNGDQVLVRNYKGSEDTIIFTANNQSIDGMNFASGRTISFAATNGLSYTDCTIGGGKNIVIQESQDKSFIIGALSTFTGRFDVDTLAVGDKWIDLTNIPYAGIIQIYSSGGLNPVPYIQYVRNDTHEILTRKYYTDITTANPIFSDSAGTAILPDVDIDFGTILITWSPASLDSHTKYVELTYSIPGEHYIVTSLFT